MAIYRFCDTYVYCFDIEADTEEEARALADHQPLDVGALDFESTELFETREY